MKPDLPKMPKTRPTVTVGTMTATLDNDMKRFSTGFLRMTFEDTTARLMEGGKEVGNVTGPIGGGVQISIGDRQWYISPAEIWRAVGAADAEYMKGCTKNPRRPGNLKSTARPVEKRRRRATSE